MAGQDIAAGETVTVTNGQVTLNGNGTLTFTPADNYNGPVSFDYTVSDGDLSDTGTVNITVTPVNDAPTVVDENNRATDEDTPVTIDVLANDTDVEGDNLTVTQVAGQDIAVGETVTVANGQVTLNANGTLTFTPADNYNGPVSFDYTVSDGDLTDTGTVNVSVTAVNDAPTVVSPIDDVTANDGANLAIEAGAAFADVDSNDLIFTANGLPAGLSIDSATGRISGRLAADASANGPYTVVVTATDGNGNTVDDTFRIAADNVAPLAASDRSNTDENTPVTGDVLANDRDGAPDNDRLTVIAVDGRDAAVGRTVAGSNGGVFTIGADGQYRFDPNGDFDDLSGGATRTTTVTYQISDGQGGTDEAELTIVVEGAFEAGALGDDTVQFGDNYRKDITNAFNAAGLAGPLSYSATGLPRGLTIDPVTGIIRGNPVALGPFAVIVTATDANGRTLTSTYGVQVVSPSIVYDDAPANPFRPFPSGVDFGTDPSDRFVLDGFNDRDTVFSTDYEPEIFLRSQDDLGLIFDNEFNANFDVPKVRYQATQTDGRALPGTLTVNADTGDISGRLPAGMAEARLTVIAIDDNGDTRTREVWVDAAGNIIALPGDRALAERPDLYRRSDITLLPARDTARSQTTEDRNNPMQVAGVRLKGRDLAIDIQDANVANAAEYTATLVDGSALPSWLAFDRDTADLSGRLPVGVNELHVRVVAVDDNGDMRVLDLDMRVDEAGEATVQHWRSLSDEADRALSASGDRHADSRGSRLAAALRFNQ